MNRAREIDVCQGHHHLGLWSLVWAGGRVCVSPTSGCQSMLVLQPGLSVKCQWPILPLSIPSSRLLSAQFYRCVCLERRIHQAAAMRAKPALFTIPDGGICSLPPARSILNGLSHGLSQKGYQLEPRAVLALIQPSPAARRRGPGEASRRTRGVKALPPAHHDVWLHEFSQPEGSKCLIS